MAQLTGMRALVTGASSGIGARIAVRLAALGAHVILTARRKSALEAVAKECGGSTEILVADLGQPGIATSLFEQAGTVDILVNNAGFGYFKAFADADWERDAELIQLNVTALVELSRRFIDARAGKTGHAYLLNVASTAAYQAVPNFAVYAASKVFVRNFTEALHDELVRAKSPVSATCICPGGTHTEFHELAGAGDYSWIANRSMLPADHVAALAVRAMLKRKRNVMPGFLNNLSSFMTRLAPRWLASFMATRVMGKPKRPLPARTRSAA